jgi:hypothetical protein
MLRHYPSFEQVVHGVDPVLRREVVGVGAQADHDGVPIELERGDVTENLVPERRLFRSHEARAKPAEDRRRKGSACIEIERVWGGDEALDASAIAAGEGSQERVLRKWIC